MPLEIQFAAKIHAWTLSAISMLLFCALCRLSTNWPWQGENAMNSHDVYMTLAFGLVLDVAASCFGMSLSQAESFVQN